MKAILDQSSRTFVHRSAHEPSRLKNGLLELRAVTAMMLMMQAVLSYVCREVAGCPCDLYLQTESFLSVKLGIEIGRQHGHGCCFGCRHVILGIAGGGDCVMCRQDNDKCLTKGYPKP
ncbi:hypothetical protein GOP47_0021057 [Adiantum capillus-veneris]|uniref:Uncharacterized protein n=1 Tax=Adiantum capillus-veneris TaxID=13818 RepID=A0A9D4Z8B0_ADICA|nr:hypothetical protein GOP47_0021057 [Adiantum capillus-veneris]